jgi:hypothetical protein
MQGNIDPKALGHVRRYVRLGLVTDSPVLLVTETGKAITYWGGRITWAHPEALCRKTPGQPLIRRFSGKGRSANRGGLPGRARP